jgi:hypothetical protein
VPRGELDRLEVAAGDLVSLLIGGRAVASDVPGAPDGTVDVIIEDLPCGRTAALEVTSAADSAVVSQIRAAFGRQWSSLDLTHNWMVGLHALEPTDNIRALMDQVIPLVVSVEHTGETSVELHYNDPRYMPRPAERTEAVHQAMLRMHELGVSAIRRWNEPEGGTAGQLFLSISAGVASDPDQLNAIVLERVEAKVKKLRATKADERHLFVWMDSSHAEAELAFSTLPPPKAPTLPKGIDVLWLVEPTGWPSHVKMWRLRAGREWEVIEPPDGFVLTL